MGALQRSAEYEANRDCALSAANQKVQMMTLSELLALENEAEIDAQSFETTGIRPVDAENRASMDKLSPEAKRTEYAFRTGKNIPMAGSDTLQQLIPMKSAVTNLRCPHLNLKLKK